MKTTVSQVLREAIEHAGQSRNEIARATGVSASAISRFVESGRALRTPNVDALCAFLALELHQTRTLPSPPAESRNADAGGRGMQGASRSRKARAGGVNSKATTKTSKARTGKGGA